MIKDDFIVKYAGDLISCNEADRREEEYAEKALGNFLFYFGKEWLEILLSL